ncbi:DUF2190 family protein [Methylocystis sp. WRRC1]|uniref:DUF2190 family protein n=1 Tax=unclassified Methylocystis TaxID=2625913 RepID=UPI0001F86A8D|nr:MULTISPECIES: DUF2190 family protein [unclassified Methylocystis]MCC3246146.1 DUF2190 family protein [Methylocystis sp. WRRC1]
MSASPCFKSFSITAAAAAKTIVKYTSNRGEVAPATAATDKIAGVIDMGATGAGQMVDVAIDDVHEVTLGGTVAAGDPLTSDANSKAVAATFTSGQMKHVIGFALVSGVAGDVIPFQVSKGVIAG